MSYTAPQARFNPFHLPVEETTLAQTQNVCGERNCLSKGKMKTSSEIDLCRALTRLTMLHIVHVQGKRGANGANSQHVAESDFATDLVNLQV